MLKKRRGWGREGQSGVRSSLPTTEEAKKKACKAKRSRERGWGRYPHPDTCKSVTGHS